MERRGVSNIFGIFDKGKKSGCLCTSTDSNLYPLKSHHSALEGYPALHHYSTRDEGHEI
jgi:hypothetical protein